jgi:hypothetical protein
MSYAAAPKTMGEPMLTEIHRVPSPHPFLIGLATRLLTKADRSQTGRAVRLKLDRNAAPELYGHVDADALRRPELLLRELCATGWVRLILTKAKDFDGLIDRHPQLELLDFDALGVWAGFQPRQAQWNHQLIAHLRDHWVQTLGSAKQELLDYLVRNPVSALAEIPAADAMQCLSSLQAICASGEAMPLREASARVFQGRSKVLDSRVELLRLLGATTEQLWEAPIQLLVDIPRAFDEALFIENLVTFEAMADRREPAWSRCVLVYAAGFKGSAKRLRSRVGCRIYVRTCQRPTLGLAAFVGGGLDAVGAWLFDRSAMPVYFFGDLDFAGMQILASLREVFPGAQAWQPGYDALLANLSSGGGHLPRMALKERHVDPGFTGCSYADSELLTQMRLHGRFVDQEVFGSNYL